MQVIIKRRGHKEHFDERKLYASIYAACASAHLTERECEKTADTITKKIKMFLKGKTQIDSRVIREKVSEELRKKDSELWFFYEEHLPNLKRL